MLAKIKGCYNKSMKLNFTEIQEDKRTDLSLDFFKVKSDWIVLFTLIIVGAFLGYMISLFKPPVYEATASVTANIELNVDGSINEFMLDSQINHIGELFYSPKVIQKLIENEAKKGLSLDLETLKQIATIERRLLNTLVKIRHTDANIAAQIASDWVEILYNTLEDAYPIALESSTAKQTLFLLEKCAGLNEDHKNKKTPSPNLDTFCESMTKEQYDLALTAAKESILMNTNGSMGLSQYLNLSHFQFAETPSKPISFHHGSMAFSGSVLGLLSAIIVLLLRKKRD